MGQRQRSALVWTAVPLLLLLLLLLTAGTLVFAAPAPPKANATATNVATISHGGGGVPARSALSMCPDLGGKTNCRSAATGAIARATGITEVVLKFDKRNGQRVLVNNPGSSGTVAISVVGSFARTADSLSFNFATPESNQSIATIPAGAHGYVGLLGIPRTATGVLVEMNVDLMSNTPGPRLVGSNAAVTVVLSSPDRSADVAAAQRSVNHFGPSAERSSIENALALHFGKPANHDTIIRSNSDDPTARPTPTTKPTPDAKPSPTPTAPPTIAPQPAPIKPPVTPSLPVPPGGTPGANNTGVPSNIALTVHQGDIYATTPHQTISGLDVHGRIYVQAADVTIIDTIVRGDAGSSTSGGLVMAEGQPGLRVIDSEITASAYPTYVNGIMGSNFALIRVDINHVVDAVDITGDYVSIVSSWLHANLHYANDPTWNGGPSHDDSIQIQKGSNIVISSNSFSGAHNAAVQITQDSGSIANLTIMGNLADGGACTINVKNQRGPINNFLVKDNEFGHDQRILNCAVIAPASMSPKLENNAWVGSNTLVQLTMGS